MARFFISKEAIVEGVATISGSDAFHVARTLRMAVGDEVTLSDGEGSEYRAVLTRIRDDECTLDILEESVSSAESPANITLYMAYPKGDKLETVVQKAVELGAHRIVPFESSRCIKRPAEEKLDKITVRLNKIAEEAAKQCGRALLPTVSRMIKLKELLFDVGSYDLSIFCYEGEGAKSLKSILEKHAKEAKNISVIIGSEGGFSPEEAESIIKAGAKCANLGPRILRCETAPDYCLSAISYFLEL